MGWMLADNTKHVGGSFAMASSAGELYFRTLESVLAIEKDTHNSLWKFKLPGDYLFGNKTILLVNNTVTCLHYILNNNEVQINILGIDAKSGKLLWRRPVSWTVNDNFGGLCSYKNQLLFFDGREKPQLFSIDSRSGEIAHTYDLDGNRPAHQSKLKRKSFFSEGPLLYIGGKRLAIFDVQMGALVNHQLDISNIDFLEYDAPSLYIISSNSTSQIYCINTPSLQIIWQIHFDHDFKIIRVLPYSHNDTRQTLVAFDNQKGILQISGGTGEIINTLGNDEWTLYDAVFCSGKIILSTGLEEDTPVVEYENGKLGQTICRNDIIRGQLFCSDHQLILSDSEGLKFYKYFDS